MRPGERSRDQKKRAELQGVRRKLYVSEVLCPSRGGGLRDRIEKRSVLVQSNRGEYSKPP